MLRLHLIRSLFGYVRFSASGGFADRLLNLCANYGVKLWDIIQVNGVVHACTSVSHYKRIRPIAQEAGMHVRLEQKVGLRFVLHRYRKRLGILVGVLLFVLLMFFFSGRIWTVEVVGNEEMTDREIMEYFSDLGVYPGARKKGLKVGEVSDYVLRNSSEIAWSSINITGGNARIEIHENIVPPQAVDESKPYNVTAKIGGQILLVNSFEGQEMVKKGDAVAEGDLLISGIVDNYDKTFRYTSARGVVLAQTVRELTIEMPYEKEIVEYTGEEIKKRKLEFFGLQIPLYFGKNIEGDMETEDTENRLIILNKGLPLAIHTETQKGIIKKKITLTKEEAMAEAYRKLEEQEKIELKQAEIISCEKEEIFGENSCKLVAVYTCKEDIAVQEEIQVEQ